MIFVYDSDSNLMDAKALGIPSNPAPFELRAQVFERCRVYEITNSVRLAINVELDKPRRAQGQPLYESMLADQDAAETRQPAYIAARSKRSQIFERIDRVIVRHRRECDSVERGIMERTTLSNSDYAELLTYARDLVALSDETNDSGVWRWPEPPACLSLAGIASA